MRRSLQLLVLCLVAFAGSTAYAVCNGTCEGIICDAQCSGGSCPSSPTDSCPGHCLVTPDDECNGDGDCPGSPLENPCSFSTTSTFGHCSNALTTACVLSSQCPPGGTCGAPFSPYGGDGKLAVCGSAGDDTMNGSEGADVICGKGGDDTIDGKGGNDLIFGDNGEDTIYGGGGTDSVFGGDDDDYLAGGSPTFGAWGNDYIDGGDGNDSIFGTNRAALFGVPFEGDNVLIGGEGDDYMVGGSGRDVFKAGAGADSAGTVLSYAPQLPDDVVGTLICGGDDNDYLVGYGPAHQCMDGGNGSDTCSYSYWVTGTQDALDLGTGKSCETPSGLSSRGGVSCGCE